MKKEKVGKIKPLKSIYLKHRYIHIKYKTNNNNIKNIQSNFLSQKDSVLNEIWHKGEKQKQYRVYIFLIPKCRL